jgi:UDP-N-acetyl-D-glucosamine dehydrogenase
MAAMTEVLPAQERPLSAFTQRIETREAKVGIVGLGYAGLPLGMAFAEAGFDVTGIDLNEKRVADVRGRRSYLVDVPSERYDGLEGELAATTDYAAVRELDALTICVPTPLSKTRTPDISFVVSAAESVAANLRPGQLVVLQSTTYPGTTEEIVLPILRKTGGEVGRDFFLGYAPERVDPGNKRYTIKTPPKLVAGVTDECRERTELLYRQIVDTVVPVSSPMVAGRRSCTRTPSAPSTSRSRRARAHVRPARDLPWEVIEAARVEAVRLPPPLPGPGLGGDCIPVVPQFLRRGARVRLLAAADRRRARDHTSMPSYVVGKVTDALNDLVAPSKDRASSSSECYKADVHDTRESRASRSCASCSRRGPMSATATRGSRRSTSKGGRTRAWNGRPRRSRTRIASHS